MWSLRKQYSIFLAPLPILAAGFVALSADRVPAACFDCRAAKHVSDQAICASEKLSKAEEAYVASYQSALDLGGPAAEEAKIIAADQMRARRACNGDPGCIDAALDQADAALKELLGRCCAE